MSEVPLYMPRLDACSTGGPWLDVLTFAHDTRRFSHPLAVLCVSHLSSVLLQPSIICVSATYHLWQLLDVLAFAQDTVRFHAKREQV